MKYFTFRARTHHCNFQCEIMTLNKKTNLKMIRGESLDTLIIEYMRNFSIFCIKYSEREMPNHFLDVLTVQIQIINLTSNRIEYFSRMKTMYLFDINSVKIFIFVRCESLCRFMRSGFNVWEVAANKKTNVFVVVSWNLRFIHHCINLKFRFSSKTIVLSHAGNVDSNFFDKLPFYEFSFLWM